MTFWILSALMVLAAMGFVCLPMLRASVPSRTENESEQTLYKARISEIKKDIELGRLDKDSAEAAISEEARRLIHSSENSKEVLTFSRSRIPIILAALAVPLISHPLYYYFSPAEIEITQEAKTQPTITDLLVIAEKRLSENPDDISGWKALAPVYIRSGRYEDAIKAYKHILRLEGRTAKGLLGLTDVYIDQRKGQIGNEAKLLISETLSIDNNNPIAKFYTGIIELQKDNANETKRIWQGMIDDANGNEEWLPIIKERLAELENLNQQPSLENEVIEAAEEMPAEDRAAMIEQMVTNLAQKLEENPNDKQGWERLIRSYMVLGRREEARLAAGKASDQFSDEKDFVSFLNQLIAEQYNTQGGSQ